MLTHYAAMGVMLFVLTFAFPTLCLFQVFQGKAGYLWIPLLGIAFLCNVLGLSTVMSCCVKGGNKK